MPNLIRGYQKIAEHIFFKGMQEAELADLAAFHPGKSWPDFVDAVRKAVSGEPGQLRDVEVRISRAIRDVVIPLESACVED